MRQPTKKVPQSKWSRLLKSTCISITFWKTPIKISWNHFFWNSRFLFCGKNSLAKTKVGNSDCSLYFDIRHICHTLLEDSQDESDWRLGLWHVCFSTLLSQLQSVCTRLKLKIHENTFTKSHGAPSNKCRGSTVTKFFKRSTHVISIESNHWKENSLKWCLSANIRNFWHRKKLEIAPFCENRDIQNFFILFIPYWWSTFYLKHKIFHCLLFKVYSNVYLCSCVW